VLLKGKMLQFNLDIITEIFENALIIFMNREEKFNIESILRARLEYYGDISKWFGGRPPDYDRITSMEPIDQAINQVRSINEHINFQLNKIDIKNKYILRYEDLCENTKDVYESISNKLKLLGYNIPKNIHIGNNIDNRNGVGVDNEIMNKVCYLM